MYDPAALVQLTALAAESSARVTKLLVRKQQRAEELLGKEDVTDADLKNARSIEREIELILAAVQDYKQIIAQHEAESESRWSMIQLQDKRCHQLKQLADHWQRQAELNASQFDAMAAAFQAYVRSHTLPKAA